MVTLVQDPFVKTSTECEGHCSHDVKSQSSHPSQNGYDGYIEPDTKIPPKAKSVLAEISVNGVQIDEAAILAEAQQHPADSPGEALLQSARALVVRELLLQEARALKIKATLKNESTGAKELPEDAMIRQLMDQEIETPKSDSDIRLRYYQLHKHRFKSETIYEARHILLGVRQEDDLKSKCKFAQSLIEQLAKKPSLFKRFAKEYSECPSKNEGGNLGQLTIGSTVPEFEAVLEKMAPGEIWSEPLVSRFGVHIIFLVNKIPGEVLPFEYVEEKIGAWLEASSWSKAVSQYISILSGKAEITGIDINGAKSPLVQ